MADTEALPAPDTSRPVGPGHVVTGASVRTTPRAARVLLRARRVFDGVQGVVDHGAVLVGAGIIQAIGPASELTAAPDCALLDLGEDTVLPGLIDVHNHLSFPGDERLIRQVTEHDVDDMLARSRVAAAEVLAAGITTVRDLGALGDTVFRLVVEVASGRTAGPQIIASTAQLTTASGPNAALGGGCADLAGCRDRIDADIERGAQVVKVIVTGSLSDKATDPTRTVFTDAALTGIVEHAHRRHLRVAAHAHGAAGIAQAAKCGVDTIEHASFLRRINRRDDGLDGAPAGTLLASWPDQAALDAVDRHRPFVVPTLATAFAQAQFRTGNASGVRGLSHRQRIVRTLIEHGIPLAAGTDGGSIGSPHLGLTVEIEQLHALGMSTLGALGAATSRAAACLGLNDRGVLAPGRRADIIAVPGDPFRHLDVLRAPSLVMQAGTVLHRMSDHLVS